jgi:hypothetical protein
VAHGVHGRVIRRAARILLVAVAVLLVAQQSARAATVRLRATPGGVINVSLAGKAGRDSLDFVLDGRSIVRTRSHVASFRIGRGSAGYGKRARWRQIQVRRARTRRVIARARFAAASSTTRAPTLLLLEAPPSVTSSTTAVFKFSASIGSTYCQLDGGGFQRCRSPVTYTGLAVGPHSFAVRATNKYGSAQVDFAWSITAPSAAPTIAFTQQPPNPTSSTSAAFAWSTSDSLSTDCALDGAAFAPCASPRSLSGLAPGSHTFVVRANGASGLTATASATWTILSSADVTVSVNRVQQLGTSRLSLGATMERDSLNPWGDPTAVANGQQLLDGAITFQNQHIYGWGGTNVEPSPGVYDFSKLDTRISTMLARANARPVITLAGAPDWMTAQATNTSNYNLDYAPTPQHYDDFTDLARRIAVRYSSPGNAHPVLYYQIWNELKGFWSSSLNNWDYPNYTTLYNKLYDALKSVNPAIQVGGPYLVVEGDGAAQDLGVPLNWTTVNPISDRNKVFLEYWLANKHGADFICIDRGNQDSHDLTTYTNDQKFKMVHWYGDVVRQIRGLNGYAGQPIWYSEGFAFADNSIPGVQRAAEAAAIRSDMLAGTDVLLKWQDDGTYTIFGPTTVTGLYTNTLYAGGGQPYPAYTAYKLFHDDFPPGTTLYQATSSSPGVEAVASATRTLLINETNSTLTVSVNGTVVTLAPFDVRDVAA